MAVKDREKDKEIFVSWKEIAAYLGCKIRTCQRWEKESGLPIHRFLDSSKSRVFAYKQELDDWVRGKTPGETKNKLKYLYLLIPVAALVLIYFLFIMPHSLSQPHDFKIDGSELVILDKNNKELWRYDTDVRDLEDEQFYRNHFQFKRPSSTADRHHPLLIIRDINGDSNKEVLFAQRQVQSNNKENQLLCFDRKGNVEWFFIPGREIIFGQKQYSSEYEIHGIAAVDITQDSSIETIVISFNLYMFPTQFAVLNNKGQLLREYWNSGRIQDFSFYDMDNDGQKEILLGGCNNEYDKGFLAVLEPDFKSGSSPQTGYYKSPELKQGVEIYYILVPNTLIGINKCTRGNIIRIHIIDDKTISAETQSGISFEFDFGLKLKEIRFADRYEDLYKEAYQEGITKEKFSPKVMEELKSELMPDVLYFSGEDWTNKPLLAKNKFPY